MKSEEGIASSDVDIVIYLTTVQNYEAPLKTSRRVASKRGQLEGYFVMDLVISNRGQMTRMAPELSHPSFRTTPTGGSLAFEVRFNVHWDHIYGGSSVECEPGTLKPWSQDFTTRPRRSPGS
ncbi:hypothetical protein AVEN_45149-1 [Araneus ventricosus]|uniref:Uncharacterized protein n=1 Tax=Araneus ventricosus TaxID=182803 RepID=A0A4Y2GT69_ARAVE|nr:hypothetical protein AVEN_45149-1 [Araneus ventricosus]